MGGTGVVDRFLDIFSRYIDSGFGLLSGEVAFIATTLIVIDVTLAALFWSWGENEDIIARLVKKTLFVGVFAYIIGNWNTLARIVFESFAGLGLKASGTGFTAAELLQPGRVAQVGMDAAQPLITAISDLMGFVSFFENFLQIIILLLAWAIVIIAFFILSIQLFITLIEFKLTTLCGFVLIPFGLFGKRGADELYNTDGVAVADNLAGAPKDYGQVPKLGPPLPGDLGKPILEAQRRGDVAALPPIGAGPPAAPLDPAATAAEAARQRAEQEREAARGSRLFFGGGSPGSGGGGLVGLPLSAEAQVAAPAAAPQSDTGRKQAFLERASDRRTVSGERLTGLASPSILQAGSIIPAALITGIRSDLPGLVTAQVTQNVYDSPTGRILLIPQGSRLIGDYDADVTFGQSRILLAWNRLILPDGRSIVLERQPASDPRGFAGLQDGTNYHWGGVLKAALVSTLLGVGSELWSGNDSDLARAVRRGTQDSINRAGEQIVSRELNVRPTLTIRPGFPVRVLVTRDLILGGGQ